MKSSINTVSKEQGKTYGRYVLLNASSAQNNYNKALSSDQFTNYISYKIVYTDLRSKWWAPPLITMAIRLSERSLVTPSVLQGSRSPLEKMILVADEMSRQRCGYIVVSVLCYSLVVCVNPTFPPELCGHPSWSRPHPPLLKTVVGVIVHFRREHVRHVVCSRWGNHFCTYL